MLENRVKHNEHSNNISRTTKNICVIGNLDGAIIFTFDLGSHISMIESRKKLINMSHNSIVFLSLILCFLVLASFCLVVGVLFSKSL